LISVSLPRLLATLTSVVLLLQPVGAVFLAAALLAEEPSALQLTGVAAVVAGVLLATLGLRRTKAPACTEWVPATNQQEDPPHSCVIPDRRTS
jgi:threonine/homoserine efflux transporter RhtA